MKTIVLTGMSGSGKSTVCKYLSEKLKINSVDIDEKIIFDTKKSINEIFVQNGEKYFRELEKNTVFDVFQPENMIISLGGGAFENELTRNFLLKNSVVIYLKTSADIIYQRLKISTDRPLLNNNMSVERIESLLNLRKINYELAHFSVSTDNRNIEEIGSEIIKYVQA